MIVDSFMFFNELDLLEIRINELADVVDLFVLTEATLTHRGNKKPLYFEDNKDRFSDFNINHVVVDNYGGVSFENPWVMEVYQRHCGLKVIREMGLSPDDVVLTSDLDEIWSAYAVKEKAYTTGWKYAGAAMPLFYYYFNCLHTNQAWFPCRWAKGDRLDIEPLRGGEVDISFKNTGWHFSYMGDIQEKLRCFSHSEFDKPPYNNLEYIEHRKGNLKSLFDEDSNFVIIDKLDFLPKYVLENMSKFEGLIKRGG